MEKQIQRPLSQNKIVELQDINISSHKQISLGKVSFIEKKDLSLWIVEVIFLFEEG